jgi:prevent-host-death family protein
MRTFSAKNAKYNFGELIDLARAAPVTVAKYGRPVVVVMAVEEYERLTETAKKPLPKAKKAELEETDT